MISRTLTGELQFLICCRFPSPNCPWQAYSNYYQTYVERDVKLLVNLKDASLFEKFMKLLAGRVGQLMDYTSLANDVGVDAKTIRHWLSILTQPHLCRAHPWVAEVVGLVALWAHRQFFPEDNVLQRLTANRHR